MLWEMRYLEERRDSEQQGGAIRAVSSRRDGQDGRRRRLTAFGDIPETDAEVGAGLHDVLFDVAAVVHAIRADGINDDAVRQAVIEQRVVAKRVRWDDFKEIRRQCIEGRRPIAVQLAVSLDRNSGRLTAKYSPAAGKRIRQFGIGGQQLRSSIEPFSVSFMIDLLFNAR